MPLDTQVLMYASKIVMKIEQGMAKNIMQKLFDQSNVPIVHKTSSRRKYIWSVDSLYWRWFKKCMTPTTQKMTRLFVTKTLELEICNTNLGSWRFAFCWMLLFPDFCNMLGRQKNNVKSKKIKLNFPRTPKADGEKGWRNWLWRNLGNWSFTLNSYHDELSVTLLGI